MARLAVSSRSLATIATLVLALALDTAQGLSYSQGTSCTGNTCGVNAQCTMAVGRPVCSCYGGYYGDPLVQCRKAECSDHADCRGDQACQDGHCINPCAGVCGVNADCQTRNHVPVCSCPNQYTGDPFSQCRRMDPAELCYPTPCGVNTKCEVKNNVPVCTCLPGYTGSPLSGCRHECESDSECGAQETCENFRCSSACAKCGRGASCNTVRSHRALCECPQGMVGDPYSECRFECYGDRDCPSNKPACIYGTCKNLCIGACGSGANCELRGLTPVCSCPRDMTGDPFVACRPFEKRDLCEPNPCGNNAVCTPGYDNTNRERPVCTCPAGYTGNSLSSCVLGECQSNSECADHKTCIDYSCVDPCIGQCGSGANCNPRNHVAVCTCPDGTHGDALVSCRQNQDNRVSRARFYNNNYYRRNY